MRKPGIEITLTWVEQYPSMSAEMLGAFIKLCLHAIKYSDGSLPNDDAELEMIAGSDVSVVKNFFVQEDGLLHIPDTLSYKLLKGNTRKGKHQRKEIDMNLYAPEQIASFNKFIDWLNKNAPRVQHMQKPFNIEEYLKLSAQGWSAESIKSVLIGMHNWKPLLQKNVSAFLTAEVWLNNPRNNAEKTNRTFDSPSTKMGQQADIHNKVKEALENGN